MKFSFRQILASAGGAVLAAVIASFFGVKGTIVGVAIGSAAATFGTAFVAQSIDRGHQAVKQVVVRVPDSSTLLRRLGGTGASGVTTQEAVPTTTVAQPEATMPADQPTETLPVEQPTAEVVVTAEPTLAPVQPRGFGWRVTAVTVVGVFVLSLLFVTAVELVAGRPLADLFGGHSKGGTTTIYRIISPGPAPAPTTTTSTSSTTTTLTTTTTTSTTTTTLPGGSATTSTDNGTGSTSSTSTPSDGSTTTSTSGAG